MAESQAACVARLRLWAESDRLRAEGRDLRVKSDKLLAEGDKLLAEWCNLWEKERERRRNER